MDIWWQKMKRPLLVAGIIVASIFVIVTIVGIIGGYLFNWGWTGIKTKTLWDWLNLLAVLAIPVLVGIGAAWFTARQNHDREIAEEQRKADFELAVQNQFEVALHAYIDTMTELLLHENLSKAQRHDVVANIAQTRTLFFLYNLDPLRKGFVIIFLAASGLINRRGKIIDLSFADLRGAKLRRIKELLDGISLERANLAGSDFTGVELTHVNFQGADLRYANLSETDLSGADFNDADLSHAKLIGANVSIEQLEEAKSLKGATMPDGSIHP